jgi:hypothetical protein
MIDSFQYGKIVIDGKEYSHDVIIHPDGKVERWWRREGHIVALEDLKSVMADPPEILIIGGGTEGRMGCPQNLPAYLEEQGTKVIYDGTERAVTRYNQRDPKIKTAAALHITA